MTVVADTSVISYLILIEHQEVLRQLYGRVILPAAVLSELQSPLAPSTVQACAYDLPEWITAAQPGTASLELDRALGKGEREAIALAVELKAMLLIDDRLGRKNAERYGLETIGTLGILRDAMDAGYIDLTKALKRLHNTSFRASPALMAQVFKLVEGGKSK